MNIKKYCPICDAEHEIEIVTKKETLIIKEEEIISDVKKYVCSKINVEFMDSELNNKNLQNARDEYRIKHKLLTSKEIKEIRDKYNLSQADLALILGWGEITITRYETKEIQNEKYDEILRKISEDPYVLYNYFNMNKTAFTEKKQAKILEKITSSIPENRQSDKMIEDMLIKKHFSINEKMKGYQKINIEKILSIIKYVVDSGITLYKTKMAKLMWYIDMLYYKENRKSLTGLAYFHMNYGACPLGLNLILESDSLIIEENEYDDKVSYLVKDVMCSCKLNEDEKKIINKVIKKFKKFTTVELVKYMHNEIAYKNTEDNEFISFEYAKFIDLGGEDIGII
ncbi:MAG: DUF4065 domain-containing protein [Bacilli bacterium]|nr:DUF4065 domain-containing protein [Bacilli bacterium]